MSFASYSHYNIIFLLMCLPNAGFIGYAREVCEMIYYQPIKNEEDDQLYYTEIFLNRALRVSVH